MSTGTIIGVVLLSILFGLVGWGLEMFLSDEDNRDWSFICFLRNFVAIWVIVLLIGALVRGCHQSDWWQGKLAEEAKASVAEKPVYEPRVVARAGGCETWAFHSADRWHYFTKCPRETTTEGTYTERRGKTTVQKSESIVTENN